MDYKTGQMPNTDFRYEEFEGLLGSYHMSLLPLKDSRNIEDKKDYEKIMQVLNGFSQRYSVQSPEDAVKNPRSKETWGNASMLSNFSLLDMMRSFVVDFGVGNEPHTIDQKERYELGRTILGVFDRYGIAKIGFQEYEGKKIPLRIEQWDNTKEFKNLADIIRE